MLTQRFRAGLTHAAPLALVRRFAIIVTHLLNIRGSSIPRQLFKLTFCPIKGPPFAQRYARGAWKMFSQPRLRVYFETFGTTLISKTLGQSLPVTNRRLRAAS